MKYAYRDHRGYPGLDPDRLAGELIRIRERNGVLTPEATVKEAKSPKSILHPHFEWDDSIAAEEFRKNQAREMIRSIYIVIEENPDWQVPANINIQGSGERGYYPAADVMGSPEMRAEALRRVWESLSRLRRLYSHLEQFASIWAAVDEAEKKVAKK
jgi:hypothetical protein